jgi:FMN phosphatase YigB (HAD superfamily)
MLELWNEFYAETDGQRRSASGHGLETPLPCALNYVAMNAGLRYTNAPVEREVIFDRFNSTRAVTPGMPSLLKALDRLGIRAAVISNNAMTGAGIAEAVREWVPDSRMEFCLSSADVLFCKPAGPLFRTAARFAGVDPDDCWYCGDGFTPDVIGGLDAGMHPVHYRPAAEARLVRLTDGAGREYLAVNHWNAPEGAHLRGRGGAGIDGSQTQAVHGRGQIVGGVVAVGDGGAAEVEQDHAGQLVAGHRKTPPGRSKAAAGSAVRSAFPRGNAFPDYTAFSGARQGPAPGLLIFSQKRGIIAR